MKAILTCLLFASLHAHALTAEEILEIAKKPHNRENLVEALKIYPEAREYKVTGKGGPSRKELKDSPEVVVQEKTVDGKYIVSQLDLDEGMKVIMVVAHDPEADAYRKWTLLPDGSVNEAIGLGNLQKRTMAWTSGNGGTTIIVQEVHSDKETTWRELALVDGKVVGMNLGRAVRMK